MALVGYSDSDSSQSEGEKVSKPVPTKAPLKKLVDRENPHKIRVNLATVAETSAKDSNAGDDEPPAKRARIGGGLSAGFNSFLPAPKRTGVTTKGGLGASGIKRGLGSGVSLKTGAEPGFRREPKEAFSTKDEGEEEKTSILDLPEPSIDLQRSPSPPVQSKTLDPPRTKKPMMFKPLSVAQKSKKKKTFPATNLSEPVPVTANGASKAVEAPKKIPLFSMNGESSTPDIPTSGDDAYTPLVYEAAAPEGTAEEAQFLNTDPMEYPEYTDGAKPPMTQDPTSTPDTDPQSLHSIAAELNLSKSAQRQLFGRNKGTGQLPSAIKVINFNTDQEYAANEELRAAGETVSHNPVRAIAPGKHSLKQLVSAASGQKEALEEHFASGKRNKKEAGSRYGW